MRRVEGRGSRVERVCRPLWTLDARLSTVL
jgi:hypothetical protein